jgi:hypothetical protein
MSLKAIQSTFDDADELIMTTAYTNPWQPFDIQNAIPATPTSLQLQPDHYKPRIKRSRYTNKHHHNQKNSYAQVTATTPLSNEPNHSHDDTTDMTEASSVTTDIQSHNPNLSSRTTSTQDVCDILGNIQTELQTLKSTITTLETKVHDNHKTTTKNIDSCEHRCDEMIRQANIDQQQTIQNLSTTFLDQMILHQQTTGTLLQTMLAEREQTLLGKMNE